MTALRRLGKVTSTDLLIIGGGIGGLTAALAAKEMAPEADVLVVEKNVSGWAGQANRGAGVLMFLGPDDPIDTFVEFHCRNIGAFLEDQALLTDYARGTYAAIRRFDGWSGRLCKRKDGSFIARRFKPFLPWSITAADLDMMIPVRRKAGRAGIKFMDKVTLTDLLKDGDRVAGALGFSLLDGTCHVIKAKATIIATGGDSMRIMNMWNCQRGEGAAMAYRAGAELRNCEFAPMMEMLNVRSKQAILGAEDVMYNGKGEFLSGWRTDYDADSDALSGIVWYKEMLAGNGPITTRNRENRLLLSTIQHAENLGGRDSENAWVRPFHGQFWGALMRKTVEADGGHKAVSEVIPGIVGEHSPIKVDHDMKTTLDGLYAIGNACYTGSSMVGAVPSSPGRMRGSGLTGTIWMGIRGGESAIRYAGAAQTVEPDVAAAEASKRATFAPIERDAGVSPMELVKAVHKAYHPVGYSLYKSGERMEEALGMIFEAKKLVSRLSVSDWHHLSAANEARSMVLTAEVLYRTSLERKETRGWHVREDYPEQDDANWLKWISIRDAGGEPEVLLENLPMETYQFRP
jgi:succinate dehydrogenase / fumarate reductase, flavoprotein subunit